MKRSGERRQRCLRSRTDEPAERSFRAIGGLAVWTCWRTIGQMRGRLEWVAAVMRLCRRPEAAHWRLDQTNFFSRTGVRAGVSSGYRAIRRWQFSPAGLSTAPPMFSDEIEQGRWQGLAECKPVPPGQAAVQCRWAAVLGLAFHVRYCRFVLASASALPSNAGFSPSD